MDLLALLIFIIPCYVANAAPVLLGGGQPMDLGAKFPDGRRIFGDAKTIRGFFGGVAAGTLAGGIIALYSPLPFFGSAWAQFLSGFMLSLGALAGDALGSFIKRRIGVEPGKPFPLDQLGFIVVGLLFAYLIVPSIYSPEMVIFIVVLSYLLHIISNAAANRFGLKSVPW
ncbi:MAG: CDP-2,3-bis-(O-geranylgeranyl)-sn-glycerol synthase [Candidatus Micrarchaeota archaeon]|nr:CDP-2,3-bis-(O-geranylgeranyl)-sn-glycerol synthase [Candidatus Micrarchaeota archaeon]